MAQQPLVRQWIIVRSVSANRPGVTVAQLAQDLEVSQKTIRRDLDALRRAGFPIHETVEPHGLKRWRIEPDHDPPELTFAFDEAVSLYVAHSLLEPLAGTPFWDGARRAFAKLRARFSPGALDYIEQFRQTFHRTAPGRPDYSKKFEIIDRLMQAVEDRRAVFITYQSLRATEPVTYDVQPYGLAVHRDTLYLVGRAPQHEGVRHWKLDRMEAAELTEVRFTRPADFDLHEHFAGSFGVYHGTGNHHVKIRFAPAVARYVEESTWHASQRLTPQKDGSLLAEFDLGDLEEIKRWVLSFGRHAEVVGPEELRGGMAEEGRAIHETHASRPLRHARARRNQRPV